MIGRPSSRVLGVVGILFVGLALAAATAETALRVLDQPVEQPVGWAWHGGPEEQNELGYRGHRAAGRVDDTVLLVGDSQVETTRPFAEMPEVFLAQELRALTGGRIRVVSVGVEGWGQDQQLLTLPRALDLVRPRMVALWFTPTNDVWNNTFPTHMPRDGRPKPTFWLEGNALRGPHPMPGTPYHPPGLRLVRAWRPLTGRPMYVTDEEWEARLPPAYASAPAGPGRASSLLERTARHFRITPAEAERVLAVENFDNEKTHASIALTPRSPRLAYSIRLTRALLLAIAKLCQSRGVAFVVFYVDTGPFADMPEAPTPFEVSGRVVTLSNAAARAAIEEALAGLPTRRLTGYGRHFWVSHADAHLNTEGNRYFMSQLARHLAPSLRP